jgi:Tetratricopeptide repeat
MGARQPDTAISEHNVGSALAAMGDHTGAIERLTHGLATFEAAAGPEHPLVAVMLRSLADEHDALGQPALARVERDRAATIEARTPP